MNLSLKQPIASRISKYPRTSLRYKYLFKILLLGYLVILPDWYRGEATDSYAEVPVLIEFTKRHTQWANFLADWNEKIKPYAVKHGARSFGTIGTA